MQESSHFLIPIVETKDTKVDYKEKQFSSSVEKALQQFDSVDDWADYISRLGKLLKALQSWSPKFQNVSYYVPHPYQVARRLASSLSPNLPSGVHSKTLEVYSIIFDKIGIDTLSAQCNVWIPGVLPLMTYATLSVKPQLIELYENYILKMNTKTLEILVKPILASLLPGIDEEGSEFQQQILQLLINLQKTLNNDSLFWQSFYIIMIKNKEHRLGGLVWMIKQMPSLNAIPHLSNPNGGGEPSVEKDTETEKQEEATTLSIKEKRSLALNLLLPAAKPLVNPEVGLLIRCLVACLGNENEIMIQRGVLDLILQRLHLDSPVLEKLVFPNDKKLLVMAICEQLLKKDMSLNRRIWNWLLKPSSKNDQFASQQYFENYCLKTLLEGITDLLKNDRLIEALKITQILMHKWEIGSMVTTKMFLPLMKASIGKDKKTIIAASEYFDSIDTKIIWNSILSTLEQDDYTVLIFVLNNCNLENEEEMIVKHLPLVLLQLLVLPNKPDFDLLKLMLELIPARAFLVEDLASDDYIPTNEEIRLKVLEFYGTENAPTPYSITQITKIIISKVHSALLLSLDTGINLNEYVDIFVLTSSSVSGFASVNIIEHQKISDKFIHLEDKLKLDADDCTISLSKLFIEILAPKLEVLKVLKCLRFLMQGLWIRLNNPSKQLQTMKIIDDLELAVPQKYLNASLVSVFIEEKEITRKLAVLSCFWNQSKKDSNFSTTSEKTCSLVNKPLELVLDGLSKERSSEYMYVSEWLYELLQDTKSANRLFEICALNLLKFDFISRDKEFGEFANIEIFTYYVSTLINVLTSTKGQALLLFNSESTSKTCIDIFFNSNHGERVDISTYKSLVIEVLLNFLRISSNTNSMSVRVVLKFFETVINGSEKNFKKIVSVFLDLSSTYIKRMPDPETDVIIVSLLNIVSNVLSLSHEKDIKLDIFDNSQSHINYVDFLVSSVLLIKKPFVMNAYVKLMTESIIYFKEGVFSIILPLVTAMVSTIDFLFEKEFQTYLSNNDFQSVCLLLEGIEELLQVSHSYVQLLSNNYGASGVLKSDFFNAVVSNVFSTSYGGSGVDAGNENRNLANSQIVMQSLSSTTKCCYKIWEFSISYEKSLNKTEPHSMSLYQQSCKYKYKSRKLLEKLFMLEPIEFLHCLLESKNMFPVESTYKLIYVLDGNRPMMTLPHFFKMCVFQHNPGSPILNQDFRSKMTLTSNTFSVKPTLLMDFIYEYISNLEYSAIEDINTEFLQFAKEVIGNASLYEDVSIRFMEVFANVCLKMGHCQFGEEKKTRKDYSDLFNKYVLSMEYNVEKLSKAEIYASSLPNIVDSINHIVNDVQFSDKYNILLSSLISVFILPFMKRKSISSSDSKNVDSAIIPDYVVKFMTQVSPLGKKIKPWKAALNDFFFITPNVQTNTQNFGNAFTNCLFFESQRNDWETIIYEWSQYPDIKGRVFNDLLTNCSSTSSSPFGSWSQSEVSTKCLDYFKICYMLCISPKDDYILYFKRLINEVEKLCLNENQDIEPELMCMGFKLLRCMLLKFNHMQFLGSWCTISFILQKNLQIIYESNEDLEIHKVFQICKTLDVLVTLNYEEFNTTQEWLFIVDSFNGISKNEFVSLIDLISKKEDITVADTDDNANPVINSSLSTKLPPTSLSTSSMMDSNMLPLLSGQHDFINSSDLKKFIDILSYANYESLFHEEEASHYSENEILKDTLIDLFYSPLFFSSK